MIVGNKIEYFLNAVYYGFYIGECKQVHFVSIFLDRLVLKLVRSVVSRKKWIHFLRTWVTIKPVHDNMMYGADSGIASHLATIFFSGLGVAYFSIISFLLFGIILSNGMVNELGKMGRYLILGVPILLGYIPIYLLVFTDDNYKQYFKRFNKRTKAWKRTWLIRSFLFGVGGIVFLLIGVFLAIKIAFV